MLSNFVVSKKFNLMVVLCAVISAGCNQKVNQTQATPAPNNPLSSLSWPSETHDEANAFAAECQSNLKDAYLQLGALENPQTESSALSYLKRLNALHLTVDNIAGKTSLYRNVHPAPEVRKTADICQQGVQQIASKFSLSVKLYQNLKDLNVSKLTSLDKHYYDELMKDFKRSGVDLPKETRTKVEQLQKEIQQIGQTFNKNIREDVRTVYVNSASDLAGLPQDYIDAHPPGEDGRIAITTNYPDYIPVSYYAHDDNLRLELYKAFKSRGYPANKPVLKSLLSKRHELAQLLGYKTYAHYVTEDKMIETPENALAFIQKINRIAKPAANNDYQQLLDQLKLTQPNAQKVGDWQKTYLEKKILKDVYRADPQKIREYFSYNNVKQGMFDLTESLFKVKIQPWQGELWHESVEAYEIVDQGEVIGRFYLDMHPRDGKYSHAAQFGVQSGLTGTQLPIAALVCNFPSGDQLMEHGQVETFLHEFGHLLHSMFSGKHDWVAFSGIATERDFVEAPSQMLEEWVWDPNVLKKFAQNAKGETIPAYLIEAMQKSRDFGKGMFTRHQMFYASISLGYYITAPDELDLTEKMVSLQKEYSPFEYVDDTYFYTSFGHLDGYSAIYYTYMWSLVIAADMFSRFEQEGLLNAKTGKEYRDRVLAPGGSKKAAELVEDFLGRPYSFESFANKISPNKANLHIMH